VKNSSVCSYPLALDMSPFCGDEASSNVNAAAAPASGGFFPEPTAAAASTDARPELSVGPLAQRGPLMYKLFGVIVHRGGNAGFGHYHTYFRDLTRPFDWTAPEEPQEEISDAVAPLATAAASAAKEAAAVRTENEKGALLEHDKRSEEVSLDPVQRDTGLHPPGAQQPEQPPAPPSTSTQAAASTAASAVPAAVAEDDSPVSDQRTPASSGVPQAELELLRMLGGKWYHILGCSGLCPPHVLVCLQVPL
jgi:hypothetical protein